MRYLLTVCLMFSLTAAQWSSDPALPQLLGTGIHAQVAATSDGGVYIAWLTDGNYHVYIQRLDAAGEAQFEESGMLVSNQPNASWFAVFHMNLAVDGDDNAIISTLDTRTGLWQVYAYKIAPDGSMLWGEDGLVLSASGVESISPRLTVLPDNSVVVTWTHNWNAVSFQRVSSDGELLWGDGILIEDDDEDATLISPQPVVTAEGDVLIQWIRQSGPYPWAPDSELYLQKYDYDGNPLWSEPTIAVGPVQFPTGNWLQQSVAEGGGGSFSAWTDFSGSGNNQNAVAQHITGDGDLSWTGGVDLSTNSSNFRISPRLTVAEETHELMAVWGEANGTQSQHGVYAQRVDSNGIRLWGNYGTAVVTMNSDYVYLDLSVAGFDEELITAYIQQYNYSDSDIYATRLDADGNSVWLGGVVTVTNSGNPKSDMMIGKGPGCLFIVWTENGYVYTHCLREDGTLGAPEVVEEDHLLEVPGEYATIQEAIDTAGEGDTVLVSAGTYFENLIWPNTNGIKLIGSGEEDCIIDGNQMASVIRFEENLGGIIDSTTLISSLTIQNGNTQEDSLYISTHGGGIYCSYSNPTLKNLTITGNSASFYGRGGGIYCVESSPNLVNVTVMDNSAENDGGGIFCYWSNLILENVIISGNSAIESGGGIEFRDSSPTFTNVTINNNLAEWSIGGVRCIRSSTSLTNVSITDNIGGGLGIDSSNVSLVNVTIIGNSASNYGGGISAKYSSSMSLVNCILWNDSPQEVYFSGDGGPNSIVILYSDIQGGEEAIVTNDNVTVYWEEGNIDADPLFCYPDSGDYTLAENSPCVGTGENGANMGALGVGCEAILSTDMDILPLQYVLHQNYPNPFNPVTKIRFDLPEDADVQLSVYDVLGREVAELVNSRMVSGFHEVIWDANDVSSGIYLCRLTTHSQNPSDRSLLTKKMVVVK